MKASGDYFITTEGCDSHEDAQWFISSPCVVEADGGNEAKKKFGIGGEKYP